MISLKLGDISEFPFIDRPDLKSIKDGFDLLFELEAIEQRAESRGRSLDLGMRPPAIGPTPTPRWEWECGKKEDRKQRSAVRRQKAESEGGQAGGSRWL